MTVAFLSHLALLATPLAQAPPRYIPFLTPLPVWDYWFVLLVPLCLAIAIVYKSVKCHSMRTVPREAAGLFIWILIAFALAAVVLTGVSRWMDG